MNLARNIALATFSTLACLVAISVFTEEKNPGAAIVTLYSHPIDGVPGKSVTAFHITYPPGGSTPAHRHGQAFVVGHVLAGAIRSKLNDGSIRTYRVGESWTEAPGTLHAVSENASATEPAVMLAVLIHETGAEDLVAPEGPPPTAKP
jgi:quercetin dioxygenase-like cupin family protein